MKIILTICLSVFFSISQNDGWKLVKEVEEIKVYTRKVDGSQYKQIRMISKIKAPLSEIVYALEDVNYHPEWAYETEGTKMLTKRSPSNFDYYAKMNLPFPFNDRDVAITYNRDQNTKSKIVTINAKASPKLVKEEGKYVRIKDFESSYTLTPLEEGWVEVDYFMAADPAGKLPAWVVNLFTTKGPIETMKALKKLMDSDYYNGKVAEGIVD